MERCEERACRGRREPKWMLAIRDFDRRPVVGKPRHVRNWAALAGTTERNVRPVLFEPELPVRPRKAIKIVRFSERRLAVDPLVGLDLGKRPTVRHLQHPVDELARAPREPSMLGAKPLRQSADHFVITAAFARRLDQLRSKNEVLVPAAAVNIVVLEKRRCRKHDISDL